MHFTCFFSNSKYGGSEIRSWVVGRRIRQSHGFGLHRKGWVVKVFQWTYLALLCCKDHAAMYIQVYGVYKLKEASLKSYMCTSICTYVTGPAKTGHICTKYTCSENSIYLDLCLRYSCSVNFLCFLINL